MQLLVDFLPPDQGFAQLYCPEITAKQVLVDFGQLGVEIVEVMDNGRDLLPAE